MRFIPNRARDIVAEETPLQTAVNAAVEVKKSGVRVFSWGFGTGVSLATLQQMATYKYKPCSILTQDVANLKSSLVLLESALCHVSFGVTLVDASRAGRLLCAPARLHTLFSLVFVAALGHLHQPP